MLYTRKHGSGLLRNCRHAMLHPISRDDSKNNCVRRTPLIRVGGWGGGGRERRQWEVESDTLPTTFDQLYNVMGWNRLELKNDKAIISGFE